jgi:CRISPR-associated protein Csd1
MGENAPVSERAASAYALALNKLLDDEDTHLNMGPISVCIWAKMVPKASGQFKAMLGKAYPEHVKEFLRAPFAGLVDREVLNRDRLYTVALSGNAGRVVVQHWLDQTLDEAASHFAKWWNDLQIISVYQPASADKKRRAKRTAGTEPPPSPFAIPNLGRAMLRQTKGEKDDKLAAERIVQLHRAALEGISLPITMLKPILDEFHSALVKDDEKKPTYPFSQSRFALIKLILIRNRMKEDQFMPTYELVDTSDTAYNLGRLLAVFEMLQDRYHNYEKKGPGVVERYYAAASSAPASAFPILCRLARHHLSKVRREDEKAAYWIEKRITEVMSKFQSASLGKPPTFPRVLTLEEQGRFALGFYQQKASRNKSAEKADQPAEQ